MSKKVRQELNFSTRRLILNRMKQITEKKIGFGTTMKDITKLNREYDQLKQDLEETILRGETFPAYGFDHIFGR